MEMTSAIQRGAELVKGEILFLRSTAGVLNHRVKLIEYREHCNDYRWQECWLYWTWCDYALWAGKPREAWPDPVMVEEGDGDHVCLICEYYATRKGEKSSDRISMMACDVTNGERWCSDAKRWVS